MLLAWTCNLSLQLGTCTSDFCLIPTRAQFNSKADQYCGSSMLNWYPIFDHVCTMFDLYPNRCPESTQSSGLIWVTWHARSSSVAAILKVQNVSLTCSRMSADPLETAGFFVISCDRFNSGNPETPLNNPLVCHILSSFVHEKQHIMWPAHPPMLTPTPATIVHRISLVQNAHVWCFDLTIFHEIWW